MFENFDFVISNWTICYCLVNTEIMYHSIVTYIYIYTHTKYNDNYLSVIFLHPKIENTQICD